jgi:hypothetical protein
MKELDRGGSDASPDGGGRCRSRDFFEMMISVGGNCRRLNSFAGDSTRLRMSSTNPARNPSRRSRFGRRLLFEVQLQHAIELVVRRQRLIVKLSRAPVRPTDACR